VNAQENSTEFTNTKDKLTGIIMSGSSTLLPPSDGTFGVPTPSGLTPNTRSEAEKAFFQNSLAQTDSAAPDQSVMDEAHQAYRRPGIPRTSSTNYENALRNAHHQSSVSSDMSAHTDVPGEATGNATGEATTASPTSTTPFPQAGQGVVPLNYGSVSAGQADAVKKSRSRGLSLGGLARQQSWNEQDYKRLYNADLLSDVNKDEGGYDSVARDTKPAE
jgi:hypothetical protein